MMSTAASTYSTKKLTKKKKINSILNKNLGEIEIDFEISNGIYEKFKINLNDDIISEINKICKEYEINDDDKQILMKNTFEEIDKAINEKEKILNDILKEDIQIPENSYKTPRKNKISLNKKTSVKKSSSNSNIKILSKKNNKNNLKSPIKKKLDKSFDPINNRENIYNRAISQMKIHQVKMDNLKEDLQEKYSFAPEINKNKNNKLLSSKSYEKLKIEDRLLQKGLKSQKDKMNKFIERSYIKDVKYIIDDNDKFSYTPKLNKRQNKKILKNYNFIYQQKNDKTKKKIENLFNQIYTFQPNKKNNDVQNKKNNNVQYINKKELISRLMKTNVENEEIIIDKKSISNNLKHQIEMKKEERKIKK
jgi:hypothetical protein